MFYYESKNKSLFIDEHYYNIIDKPMTHKT